MRRRRPWEEEELGEPERTATPQLAKLDETKRAGVLEELQRAGGNRAFQEVVGGQTLQREAAPALAPKVDRPFMKITGQVSGLIKGPSTLKGHQGEFELVENYELEAKATRHGHGEYSATKREYSDLKVVVRKSAGITQLRAALARNEPIETIVIVTPLDDGVETVTFTKAFVVGLKDVGNGNVELRFSFQKVAWDAGGLETQDEVVDPG